jgi:hypothetical protein
MAVSMQMSPLLWFLLAFAGRGQIASESFSLVGKNATLNLADLVVDGLSPRDVFHIGINYKGGDANASVLRRFLDATLASVRNMPSFNLAASFNSAKQLVSHIKQLADAEIASVTAYGPEQARRDAPTKDYICERIRQETPANLVDGMWANTFTPSSVPERWQLLVEKIRWEEQGEGDLEKNHCYMWRKLTDSLHFGLPKVESREYADLPELSPRAFVNPSLATAFGHLHGYWPEKLGAIAYFETMSTPFSHRSAHQLRVHGVDPAWYVVHRSIDNGITGHSAMILDAIVDYIDGEVKRTGGNHTYGAELARRVFAGFLLYESSFMLVDEAVRERMDSGNAGCPDPGFAWMVEFVRRFANEATFFHKRNVSHTDNATVRLGELMLSSPADFVRHMAGRCDLVKPDRPAESLLVKHFEFGGPMYGVASTEDLQHIQQWIRSLPVTSCTVNL